MKRKMFNKVMAASLTAAMAVGLTACGGTAQTTAPEADATADTQTQTEAAPAEATTQAAEVVEEEGPQVLTDENGNVYDLGGMEIIIRNWWSGDPVPPTNDYEEARDEYREWIQETYNFTIKEQAISDWGSTPADFVEYATTGGDENYVFILRDDPAVTSAMASGLMKDLSKIDCLDFSDKKFTKNRLHEQYSKGDSIYCMFAGDPEPRTGVYFNKRILTEAGINPEDLYTYQENNEWTWDKFEEVMQQVQRDIDNDGVIDIYGVTMNASNLTNAAVWSNNAEYVGQENGEYVYKLENPETLDALEWSVKMFDNYVLPQPEDSEWDFYKEAYLNGEAAFMVEDAYAATQGNFLYEMEDDFGFVCFPMGPNATDYTNCYSNNPAAIPACYDDQKAWNIAFAYNLYNSDIPGYEDYEGWKSGYYNGFRDTEAVDLTLTRMMENGMITFDGIIPNLKRGEDLTWGITKGAVVSTEVEEIRETWKAYITEANGK